MKLIITNDTNREKGMTHGNSGFPETLLSIVGTNIGVSRLNGL